jgi:hypothetical protein
VDDLLRSGDGLADAPLDVDYNSEDFHQDSAADSMRGLDGGLGMDGISSSGGAAGGETPDYENFSSAEVSLSEHLMAQAGAAPFRHRSPHRRPDHRRYRRDRLLPRLRPGDRPPPVRASGRCRARARRRAEFRPGRRRRPLAVRMPRHPGARGEPLRSGHGAPDRQSRLPRPRQPRRAPAHLPGRRRGPCGHDPRIARL